MDPAAVSPWSSNWIWGLPLIVITVAFHGFCLGLLHTRVSKFLSKWQGVFLPRRFIAIVMGVTALCAALLHGIEALMWAVAYLLLGALPNHRIAVLYSLGAMTTFGNADIHLGLHWQLMGVLEASNGWILFGLTTAFMFTIMQSILLKPHS
jgi:hypothetical protein